MKMRYGTIICIRRRKKKPQSLTVLSILTIKNKKLIKTSVKIDK